MNKTTQKTFHIVVNGKTHERTYAVEHAPSASAEDVYAALEEQANREAANLRRGALDEIHVHEPGTPRHDKYLAKVTPAKKAPIVAVPVETGVKPTASLETGKTEPVKK